MVPQKLQALVAAAGRHGQRRVSSSSSSSSTAPRVLCSVAELQALRGRALKFPLQAAAQKQSEALSSEPTTATAAAPTRPRRRSQALATGFVFLCEETAQPRAFVNSCPHARLELDLDDSDFFCEGFLQCKAHGAFFDPQTGMCLQGPTGSRAGQHRKTIPGLPSLAVRVDESGNVVLVETSSEQLSDSGGRSQANDEELSAYRLKKQQELAVALSGRASDMREIQQTLHEKAMARIQKYKQQQQGAAKPELKEDGGRQ